MARMIDGYLVTKGVPMQNEIGECVLRVRALTALIKSATCHEDTFDITAKEMFILASMIEDLLPECEE